MHYLLQRLKPAERRGSKARCHLLTHGSVDAVAERLTTLIAPYGIVTTDDRWMPRGFIHTEEAQFGKVDTILDRKTGEALADWWLANSRGRMPHWDIASSCIVEGRHGIVLIEAKSYDKELVKEEAGRKKPPMLTAEAVENQGRVAACIKEANRILKRDTGAAWKLSPEHHYEMSMRFAWACKMAELGLPVILVYLGFLNATEMVDKGLPFASEKSWEDQVKAHSRAILPEGAWGTKHTVAGQPFIPLIKTYEQQLKG